METDFVSLETASKILCVPVETLFKWNEYNILKPTITLTGQVGYTRDQINQFMAIQEQLAVLRKETDFKSSNISQKRSYPLSILSVFAVSLMVTVLTSQFILTRFVDTKVSNDNQILSADTIQAASSGPLTPLAQVQTEIPVNSVTAENFAVNNLTYSQAATFESNQDVFIPVFEKEDEVIGKTPETGLLATTLFGSGSVGGVSPTRKIFDMNIVLVLLTLFVLSIPFIKKKQPKMTYSGFDNNQKVMELNQRADGSVVLCYQGREFKISKPELDSESDQFIERLFAMMGSEAKEIDYDASKDEDVSFNAPLSKLVTRLGFVGIKRDLFFPRTSKNRVLFRKYLTQEDLKSIDMNVNELTGELSLGN